MSLHMPHFDMNGHDHPDTGETSLAILNRHRKVLHGPSLLHDLIASPEHGKAAIEFLLDNDELCRLTYSDFAGLSEHLADRISDVLTDGRRGSVIPIVIPQSPELYLAWRAVLQAGYCVCPVSPDTPPARLRYILDDVAAELVLFHESASALIQSLGDDIHHLKVSLKELRQRGRHGSTKSHPIRSQQILPSSPAYIMYTSGSTGMPKGVQMSHFSACQSLLAHDEHIPSFKRFLQFASPTFDVSIFEIFFPFYRGATLVSRSREMMLSDLPGTIQRLNADAAELTPTVAGTLLRSRSAAPCLKLLLTIGEMLTKQLIIEFGGSATQQSMLYAMYGPTEAAIHCTIAPALGANASSKSIGRPFSTVTALILRWPPNGAAVQIANAEEEGELAIAGQLADGYLNRAEQTKEAFIDLPGLGRVYRTGDRAVCKQDGSLEILGRTSTGQVKLRGQRVELGEVEEVAIRTEEVNQAAAVVIDDTLVLFCSGSEQLSHADVAHTCKTWLPPYMRPNEIKLQHSPLPKLASGKLDRKTLENQARDHLPPVNGAQSDFASIEESVVGLVCAKVLHRQVTRDEDLWASGLDSLSAIRIASGLRQRFPSVDVSNILRCTSIAEIARLCSHETHDSQQTVDIKLIEDTDDWTTIQTSICEDRYESVRALIEAIYPCTAMQIGMLAETTAQEDMNFNSITLELDLGLSFDRFCSAFTELAAITPILRSGFVSTGYASMPFVQVVWRNFQQMPLNLLHPLRLSEDPELPSRVNVAIHHALYDGWSWDLILRDLNALLSYKKLVPRSPFNVLSRDMRGRAATATSLHSLGYWQALLRDSVTTSFPPLVSSRPPSKGRISASCPLDVEHARLSEVSASFRITKQAFLQTCWAIVLSAYTDSKDVTFGTVISGRHVPIMGIEQVIGPCLATLPTRLDLSRVRTLRDLLNYIQRQNLDSLQHFDTPLAAIRKDAGLTGRDELFDTVVVWQEQAHFDCETDNTFVRTVDSQDALDYAVVLEVESHGNSYMTKLTFNNSVLCEAQAQILISQIDELMQAMLTHPELEINDVWSECSKQALSISNAPYQSCEKFQDLVEPIKEHARTDSERLAIRFVSDFDTSTNHIMAEDVTYAELWRRASCMSENMSLDHGIMPDDLVCIMAPKSVVLYIAILAAVSTGAGYMCIDPTMPRQRILQVLDQARPALLLTASSESIEGIPCPQCDIQTLITDKLYHRHVHNTVSAEPDHLAYAVFTSGTTGVPKGVLMTRKNLISHINCLKTIYPHAKSDSLLQACSPAFDVSVFEIFWTWHMGMTLVSASNDVLFRDIEAFVDTLKITHLSMTPSVAALISPRNVPSVKMLVTAGEPMNSKVFHEWAGRGLYQGYGPSETTNICNVRPLVQPEDAQNNVGPAFTNTSLFVCKRLLPSRAPIETAMAIEDFQLVPIGAVGEIWIGGEQVARGYVDPQLTAHSFLDHPEYGWLYRSGDIGRILADGSVVVLGREDDQAKVRGQRIELGEVSGTFLANGSVYDAVAVVEKSENKNRLLAFVTPNEAGNRQSGSDLVKDLFSFAQTHLPIYMVPDAIVPVDAMPLTKQGKVNKKQLVSDFLATPASTSGYCWRTFDGLADVEPLTGLGLSIAKALSKTVDVPLDVIGSTTSFYALGLDSISAIRFSHNLKHEGLSHFDVSTILKHASVGALAKILPVSGHDANPQPTKSRAFSISSKGVERLRKQLYGTAISVEKVLPCTNLQLSMLAASEDGTGSSYRNRLIFKLNGDLKRFRTAWERVQQRQQLLRTTFVPHDDVDLPYILIVLKGTTLSWSEAGRDSSQEANPVSHWVTFRTRSVGDATHLMLDIHHVLYDAEAMVLLLKEVELTYNDIEMRPVVHFDAYLDHSSNIDTTATDSFWQSRLSNVSPSRLVQHLQQQAQRQNRALLSSTLESSLTLAQIEQLARQQAVTIQSFLQGALARLLFHYLSTSTVCFGTVFSGRNIPVKGVEHIVGPCFNTLPISAHTQRNTTNSSLVRAMHEINLEILPFQPSSLRDLQRSYSPDGKPLFDVLLLFQQGSIELNEEIWSLESEHGDMDFPFIFEVQSRGDKDALQMNLHSNTATETVLQEMLIHFNELLTHTVRYPEALVSSDAFLRPPFLEAAIPSTAKSTMNGVPSNPGHDDDLSDVELLVRDTMLSLSRMKNHHVSRGTTIFKLGLDSINAVQLASKLRAAGYWISSSDILEGPTLEEIAAKCLKQLSGAERNRASDFKPDLDAFANRHRGDLVQRHSLHDSAIAAVRPCTPLQCGILSQFERSKGKLYYNTLKLKLHESANLPDIVQAWQKVTRKHEMLRTGFAECDDPLCSFAMLIWMPGHFGVPLLDSPAATGTQDSLLSPPWHLYFDEEARILELGMLHALYDAQSLDTMLADVAKTLNTQQTAEVDRPHTSIDTALASILAAASAGTVENFWRHEDNLMQPTKFPDMNVYNASESSQKVNEVQLSQSLCNIEEACSQLECTFQTACQVAWSRVLAAYTGQERVTFGVILSGRNFGDEWDDAVFPCINTLPCTVSTSGDDHSLLRTLAKTNSGLLKYQHTPLTSIRRWQGLEEEAFNTVLVLQKFASKRPKSVPWEVIEEVANAEYGVSIEIVPNEETGTVLLHLTYSEQLLSEQASKILLREFGQMLLGVLKIDRELSFDRSVLAPVADYLPTDTDFLHELLEHTTLKAPHATALEFVTGFDGEEPILRAWTYAELNSKGSRVANFLLAKGVQTGDLVATCFDKCPEASFAILGVLKAGCAYVAIDPGAPPDRKNFIIHDAGCKVVLTVHALTSEFDAIPGVFVIAVDSLELISRSSDRKPRPTRPLMPQDTCYCLYTSGTTGTPKGCLISHKSAVQAMMSFQRIFAGHWNRDSRWLQFASFHFDVSVLEQYWSWSVGIRMLTAPRDLILEDLPTFLRQTRITHLDLTPTLARLITPAEVPSLCTGVFIVGGEQVSQDIIDKWGDAGCLYNFYGPSEVTIGCTVHPRVKKGTKPTNIGQLWDNVGAYVLKPGTEEPVMRGAIGELCLTGVLVGKGYLNRPELTEEKFATLRDGVRIYRTGDIVRLLHDDSFDFLGRIDDQVKLRGQRLEIGEINQVIKSSADCILGVATMVIKHPKQNKEQLISFCTTAKPKRGLVVDVLHTEEAVDLTRTIQQHCSSKLPGYMSPSMVFMVSNLPLSANNKIDLKALIALYERIDPTALTQHLEGEKTLSGKDLDNFRTIAKIISRRFKIPDSSVQSQSRLFELGLDSISAVGLSRVLRAGGLQQLSVQTIMKSPVVMDLVLAARFQDDDDKSLRAIQQAKERIQSFADKHASSLTEALGVQLKAIENISPCTPLQEGMISGAVNSDVSDTTYFAEFGLLLQGNTSQERLEAAWHRVEQLSSILRTYFVPTEDGYAQVVLRPGSGAPAEDVATSGSSFADWISSAKVFGRSRPWKLYFDNDVDRPRLRIFVFHGVYDGISLDMLLEKVAGIYNEQAEADERSNFYEVLPYGPLALAADAKAFWKHSLKHARRSELRAMTKKASRSSTGISSSAHCSIDGLDKLCRDLNVTLPAVFHAIWLYNLVALYSHNPTIGVVVSGRTIPHSAAETTIGPLFNTIPSYITVDGHGSTIHDLIKACHKFNTDAIPFQHTALRDIAKWVGQEAGGGLVDSLFVFQREAAKVYEHDLWEVLPSPSQPDYPLNLEVTQKRDGQFSITVVARSDYVTHERCEELVGAYLACLQRVTNGEMLRLNNDFGRYESESTPSDAKRPTLDYNPSGNDIWTETHQQIRQEISRMADINIESIGLKTPSLFGLGLDSIDVMKLATRLKKAGIKIPVSSIMRRPTVDGIAAETSKLEVDSIANTTSQIMAKQRAYRDAVASRGVSIEDVEMILPVTPMQEGLLLEYEKYYNITTYNLPPSIDLVLLEEAWNEVVKEQPILRSIFVDVARYDLSEAFLQVVKRSTSTIETSTDPRDMDSIIGKIKDGVTEQGLATPTLKVVVSSKHRMMVVAMPHAAYDGWSIQLLHQSVAIRYAELKAGRSSGILARVPYTKHLVQVVQEAHSINSRDFWTGSMEVARPTVLSGQRANHDRASHLIQQQSIVSADAAGDFCKHFGNTMQSLGLAVVSLYLMKQTQQKSVCFGLVLSGRTTDGSESIIFPTFNTVIYSLDLAEDDTAGIFVQRAHHAAMEISEHQHFPLREILKISRRFHGPGKLFNTLFTYQKVPGTGDGSAALYEEVQLHKEVRDPPYAVNIELEVKDGRLMWTVASQAGMFDVQQAEECLRVLDQLLQDMVQKPDAHLFSEAEQHALFDIRGASALTQGVVEPIEGSASSLTPTEIVVREVLADVSETDPALIGKKTNLFNLGLDSISTIKLSSALKQRGIRLPISKILEAQTVEGIAVAIEASQKQTGQPKPTKSSDAEAVSNNSMTNADLLQNIGLGKEEVESVLAPTAGQQYMLEMWQKSKRELFYSSFWYKIGGDVTEAAFRHALDKLVEETPILRTTFVRRQSSSEVGTKQSDGILQVVLTARAARARRNLSPWAIDIRRQSSADNSLVTLRIHHALYDAVSISILLEQLNHLCSGRGSAPQNRNFASYIDETRILTPPIKDRQRQFWTSYLDPVTAANPVMRPKTSFSPRLEHFNNEVLPIADLRTHLRSQGVSIQAFFFTIIGHVYHARQPNDTTANSSKPDSVLLGIYLSLRNLDIPDVPRLAAPTVNIVPLRVQITSHDGIDGIWATARQVQRDLAAIGKAENCGVTLKEVWEWTGGRAKAECVVNFLSTDMEQIEADGEDRRVWHADEETVKQAQLESSGHEVLASPSPFALQEGDSAETNGAGWGEMPWCVPTIDVEAKISGEGFLGVGVFGQEEALGGEDGLEAWFEVIGRMLVEASSASRDGVDGKGKGKAEDGTDAF